MNFANLILYSLTQFFGLFIAKEFLNSWDQEEILKITQAQNPLGFLIYALALILIVIFLLYFREKPNFILKSFISLIVWAGIAITLQLFLPVLTSYFLSIFFIWLFFTLREIWFHNLVIVFSVSGIAGLAGLNFSIWAMILILAIVSLYDYWLIKSQRHMFHIAGNFLKEHIFLGLVSPKTCQGYFCNFKKDDFKYNNYTLLGAGDLAFPLMFASSVLKHSSVNEAIIVVLFGIVGLFSVKYFIKRSRLIPALIPITAFLILGYIFTVLF